jgi:hypothetical protein
MIDADTLGVTAQVPLTRTAIAAMTACDVPLSRNTVSDFKAGDSVSQLYDSSVKFVSGCHGNRNGFL